MVLSRILGITRSRLWRRSTIAEGSRQIISVIDVLTDATHTKIGSPSQSAFLSDSGPSQLVLPSQTHRYPSAQSGQALQPHLRPLPRQRGPKAQGDHHPGDD